jgi:RHH-type transcriptional regulator, proline utilization regulon repressor / proline dehydrogenase / delta 1-pyrroline-5-carboxylate dehydrogenase
VQDRHSAEVGVLNEFRADYAPADEPMAARFLANVSRPPAAEQRIDARARRLVEAIRSNSGRLGGIEDLLHAYSLSTKEGLALMVLAEALLRVPDDATVDQLIEDKISAGDWSSRDIGPHTFVVSASAWTLGVASRIIAPTERPKGIVEGLIKRLGMPAVRAATRQAMRLLGAHFVLGENIDEALARAVDRETRYSFDMLGEGARTHADAERYFAAYANAIELIGRSAGPTSAPNSRGISVKLSALHPRYEAVSRGRVLAELAPKVLALARRAKHYGLNCTIDAEEADRLELSLAVVARVLPDASLAGWPGFGLAVQAYQKRAPEVIDWLAAAARALDRRLTARLVKGAYWDTEIKRAQERGLSDYPVFTRKAMTDLCYMACARQLLDARPALYPQFATHNALTIASLIEDAGGVEGFEFQRLHGMGEALYKALHAELPATALRVYAPVGGHRDLLAYLVRRLLENGAHSSFVSAAADPAVPIESILIRPQRRIGDAARARNPKIPLPRDLYAPTRLNSRGVEFGDRTALDGLLEEVRRETPRLAAAAPSTNPPTNATTIRSPIDGAVLGQVRNADAAMIRSAVKAASAGTQWPAMPVQTRSRVLERAANLLEQHRGRLIALLQSEGGKALDDAVAELREAVDMCRYYAADARRALVPQFLPGPTGETNELRYRARGVFVCISPWNFPLAIFLGQVSAALLAGNAVLAKPAEQTPLVATEAVRLLHAAGVPAEALHLLPGDGETGAALVSELVIAGVAFTGSTEVGRTINRTLAAKNGPIVPLIAETGGINPMIVDTTALPEQVVDDVLTSAFRSAGQRCSALRLLCVQADVAERVTDMIAGAARELQVGDPREPSTHVGPVIDAQAKAELDAWLDRMEKRNRLLFRWDKAKPLPTAGTYVPPAIIRLEHVDELEEEVFGPILHVVQWRADELDDLLAALATTGFALTLGIHSRIDGVIERIASRLPHGNVYVNRNMIGAVVGTQPFGGTGLSGTGPKAGGPNYLRRFANEQVVTNNTAAVGGNASLLADEE